MLTTKMMMRAYSKLSPNKALYDRIKAVSYTEYNALPLMAVFVRIAFHDAGTYDKATKTGGPNGSIRFPKELAYAANTGLDQAFSYVGKIKNQFSEVSWADLIQALAVTGIEFAGGPLIPFRFGRVDITDESQCDPDGRLPDARKGAEHLREVFGRMGFDDKEIVALSGAHTLGRAFKEHSGFDGKWTENNTVFDNSYFVELLYKKHPDLLRMPSDVALLDDHKMKKWVEKFANDQGLFFREYAGAHQKLSELSYN